MTVHLVRDTLRQEVLEADLAIPRQHGPDAYYGNP